MLLVYPYYATIPYHTCIKRTNFIGFTISWKQSILLHSLSQLTTRMGSEQQQQQQLVEVSISFVALNSGAI